MSNYVKQVWIDGPDGQTPLDASRLNHMEDGISAAITQEELSTSLADFVTDDELAAALAALPPSGVVTVNGQSGNVTLDAASVGAAATSHTHGESDISGLTSDLASKYTFPTGGIPYADLETPVRTSLGKADSALQSVPSQFVDDTELAAAISGLYTKPAGGIPKIDLASTVQASLTAADNAIPNAQKAANNGVATLDSTGKLVSTQLPAIAFSTYLGTSANQSAMLALTGNKGDWTTRTDLGTTWLITGTDTTQLSSWTQLAYPTAPVTSVFGRTGTITATKSDVGLDQVDNTSDANKPISSATSTALASKAPIANPTFTGTVGGITKSMVGLGNVDNTADTAKSFTASQISNSTSVGRSVLTAVDGPAARAAIGAGTSSLAIGTTSGSAADATTVILRTEQVEIVRRYSSGAWPVIGTIPDGAIVHWIGPSAPPIGGNYARAGIDIYTVTVS